MNDAEEDDVATEDCDARVLTDVWPELIKKRILPDVAESFAKLTDEVTARTGLSRAMKSPMVSRSFATKGDNSTRISGIAQSCQS